MSTLQTTNLKNPSSGSNNLVLNSDGTIGGSSLAGASDVAGINTTGTVTSGTTALTVTSATGITAGMFVVGQGIAPGTTVTNIVGTAVTLSANAGASLSTAPVTFFSGSKIVSPGAIGGMLCRAWVNFNGTGTVAIRASYNVSSITDNGTGDYTLNFTTALADANYSVVGSISLSYPGAASYNTFVPNITAVNTTTAARIGTGFTTTPTDMALVCVAIFR